MNSKQRWLVLVVPLTAIVLLCGVSGLVLSQGPVLTTLPTPTPIAGHSEPPKADSISTAALPDLIITDLKTEPATPLVGQPTQILVTIKNNSTTDIAPGNNFNVDLYIDPPHTPEVNYHQLSPTDDLPWGVQWFWVPAGSSYTLSTTWVFTDVRTFELWALVDSDGENESDNDGVVTESNEENNAHNVSVSVLTSNKFNHATHQDFLTNMASTLENDDQAGVLRLSRFEEPPFWARPFTDDSCQITPATVSPADYNMTAPDSRLNQDSTDWQLNPHLIADGEGVVIAVWEDWRNGEADSDIYLRYSTDWGTTWQTQVRVNDDPAGAKQRNPVTAFSDDGTLMVAWQDDRNDDWDIYTQQFELTGSVLTRPSANILVSVGNTPSEQNEEQINPDIAVDDAGNFHVVWQDRRNTSNYDIFATSYISAAGTSAWTWPRRIDDGTANTQQKNPAIEALDWLEVVGVDYSVAPTAPYTVTVNQVISQPATILVVTWEDNRNGPTDIAMTISPDGGETFDIDQFVTNSSVDGNQQQPDVTLTKGTSLISFAVPVAGGVTQQVELEVPVSQIHTVWQGYSTVDNSDRNIYYALSQLGVQQVGTDNRFEFTLSVGGPEKLNQNDLRSWQSGPVDQLNPAMVAIPCGQGASEEDWNLFITWADARNYDDLNYDIYYSLKSTCSSISVNNQMLANGVRLANFDTSNPYLSEYDQGNPPPARQDNPSVAADIQLQGATVSGGYLYLAWEDNRASTAQQDKDIYFARSNLTFANQPAYNLFHDGAGSQISKILDTGSTNTSWYTLVWSAETPASTYITLQTRLGNTISELLASAWYPQRFPYQPQSQLGDCAAISSGAPLAGYDAPGQHIEDAAGNYWPQARYIQYRVNFYTRDGTKTPELYDLTLYYESGINSGPGSPGDPGSHQTFLPIILK